MRQIDEKEQIERRYKRQLEETNDKLYETEKQLDGQLEDLRHDALESSFSAHDLNEADFPATAKRHLILLYGSVRGRDMLRS
ncbi:hypothetical protein LR68_03033 [Anoxybacillus sp. BCO1]|nr:hypothetical protein LR68_03033 [Anoxybacillus sp. BCO1]